ncbi:hypothetical protein [Pseudomonas sp. NFX15]|uniref:hypothetical protein n=1 Tax=Pseudomonas sp. NFX15 TaxID=2816958 RepID=UPI003B8BDEDC
MNTGLNYTSYVCAGGVILLADELSGADRQDGLDALLYAYTVASHKCPDFRAFGDWAQANKLAMRTLGGALVNDSHGSFPAPLTGSFTLSEWLPQVVAKGVSASALTSLADSLERISRQTSASPSTELLRRHAVQQERWVRLQVAVMSTGTRMTVFTIAFEYGEPVAGNLAAQRFQAAKVNANVAVSGYQALVEREDYDLSRATIISLLGERRQEQVVALH